MNLLVTGATGFIGSAFVRLALARGHRVGALVRPRESLHAEDNLVWLPGTLAEPPWEKIARFAPDACVHAAWIATPGVYLESPENADWLRWSFDFVCNARDLAGVRRFLVLGTCIEYGIDAARREPLHETRTPIAPTSFYAKCKNELRLALEAESARAGSTMFDLCWGRVFYPYGPGEHPQRLCSSLIARLQRDEKVLLQTPDSVKDYIHIDDLAAAMLAAVETPELCAVVNLGTGTGVSVREIAGTLGRLLDRSHLIEESIPPRPDPFGYIVADPSRLKSATGWAPCIGLDEGLAKLVQASTHHDSTAH